MKKLYVIGNPIEYSLSPLMHNAALKELGLEREFTYNKMEILKEDLEKFVEEVREGNIGGASVTMPYKEEIIPLLDGLTKETELIQAVNTVYKKNSKVIGHNTDGIGCIRALEDAGISIVGKRIVLLGAGGAAKSIAISLALGNIRKILILNRTEEKAEILANSISRKTNVQISSGSLNRLRSALKDADILINSTSVGMKEKAGDQTLVTANLIHSDLVVEDIVYNPIKTKMLEEAEKAGAKIVEGVGMLVHQGAEQFEIFTGRKAPIETMRKTLLVALNEISNKKD